MSVVVDRVEALRDAVRSGPRVLPHGAGTKPALSTPTGDAVPLDVSGLAGILEYDPAELTLTALAGTPVARVSAALGEHGQYLPFDPPFAAAGATLGGVVAAGTSGANAFRHGGVRDFLIGMRFVDGTGRLVTGGGKVVKNAAGFDLPKLMIGSAGRLGVLVELSFKVFPRPEATTTVIADLGSLEAALGALAELGRGPLDLDAADLEPPGTLVLRLGGARELLSSRAARLLGALGVPGERLEGEADAARWADVAEFGWVPEGCRLIKVGVTSADVPGLDAVLARAGASTRYSLGANVAWVAWPRDARLEDLDGALCTLGVAGLLLTGPPERPLLGRTGGGAFAARVRAAIDPDARFQEL